MTAHQNQEEFRKEFQRSLGKCLDQGFPVEESFGAVWEETSERIYLPEAEHRKLYGELLGWAKQFVK